MRLNREQLIQMLGDEAMANLIAGFDHQAGAIAVTGKAVRIHPGGVIYRHQALAFMLKLRGID